MKNVFSVFLLSFLFVLSANGKDCSGVPYREFFEESTKVFKNSIKEYNSCIYQMLESYKKNGELTVIQNPETHVYMVYPKNGSAAAIVVQYSDANDKEQTEWGEDKIFLTKSLFGGNNWSMKSGNVGLRTENGKAVADERTIGWKKDRLDVVLPPGACVKKECDKNEKWSSVQCNCIPKKACTDAIRNVEEPKCLAQSDKKSSHNYEIEFLYSYDREDCSCNKAKNVDFIPPSKRSCAPSTEEYAKVKSECEARTNVDASFKLDENCKCKETKHFCDGKYKTKDDFKIAQETCRKTPGHKWEGCECKDPNGQNACVYKEKRKFVGSLHSNKMTFNRDKGSEDHFKNEPPPRMGPCDMENWLKNIGSEKKDIKNCDDYEKLVIKKRGYETAATPNFKEKRFLCTKCKDGFKPVTATSSIDGVNDDWMEQDAYSHVSECVKDETFCKNKEKREKECLEKNKIQKNIDRGITYTFVDCQCEKDKNPPPKIPRDCMDKISQAKIDRCAARDGEIDTKTCECKAPCYDIVKDTDPLPTGNVTCITETKFKDAVEDVSSLLEGVIENQCKGATMKMVKNDFAEKREQLIKDCKTQTGGTDANGNRLPNIELEVMVTNEVSCPPIVIEETSNGFADKIPGLVGGLDLKKDFKLNGKPITDPASVDCSKGSLAYSPAIPASQGKNFKTSALSQQQCENVKGMYGSVKDKAEHYVKAIMGNQDLTMPEKISLIQSSFKAHVFATANRLPHGSGFVDHGELSSKRANSMNNFYIDQVAEEIKKYDPSFNSENLKKNTTIDTIPYFGPPPKSGYEQDKDARYISCRDEANTKTKNPAEKPKLIYECMVKLHVSEEMDQLQSLDKQHQTHLANNFSKAVASNPQFKSYLAAQGKDAANFDIYLNKDLYQEFLVKQYDKKDSEVNSFLDTMKIFDLDANSKISLDVDKTVQTPLKMKCNLNYEDIDKPVPEIADHTVYYGKRPGFVERFKKDCREDFDQMLDKLQADLAKDNQDLKKDLIDEYGEEKGNKKFNKKMRDLAKKQWRYAKYNTKQVNKALDGHNRWNQFDGSHTEDDGRLNKTRTFDNEIKPKIEAEEQGTGNDWDQTKYKSKSLDDDK